MTRFKPILERSPWADIGLAIVYLLSVAVSWLVFGGEDASVLVSSAVGLAIGITGLNVIRRARRRRVSGD